MGYSLYISAAALTSFSCRPGEVKAPSIDKMAESRESADAASGRDVDNSDRGVSLPLVDY